VIALSLIAYIEISGEEVDEHIVQAFSMFEFVSVIFIIVLVIPSAAIYVLVKGAKRDEVAKIRTKRMALGSRSDNVEAGENEQKVVKMAPHTADLVSGAIAVSLAEDHTVEEVAENRRRRTGQNKSQKMASIRRIDNRPRHHPMEQNKVKKEFGQRMSPLETLEEVVEDFEVEMHNVAVKSQTFEAGELVPGATKSPSTSAVKAEPNKGLHKKTKSFRKHTDGQGRTYFESMDEETRGATVWNLPEDGFVVI